MEIFGFKCQKEKRASYKGFKNESKSFHNLPLFESPANWCIRNQRKFFFHTSFWHLKKVMIIYFFIPANILLVRFGALVFYIYNEKVTYSFSSLLLMNNSKRFARFGTIRAILKTWKIDLDCYF